jgi:hypothetical protein
MMSSSSARGAATELDSALDKESARLIGAMDHVRDAVAAHAADLTGQLEQRIAQVLAEGVVSPVDPRELPMSPFRAFGVEVSETRWTQWLASMLEPESGETLSRLTWEALARAIEAAARRGAPVGEGLLSADDWRAKATAPLRRVRAEWITESHGRPDLLVEADGVVAVIEIKLDAPWSDGKEKFGQARAYAAAGRELLEKREGTKLGLVLLTKNAEMDHPEDWLRITWAELGRAFRVSLRASLNAGSSPREVLDLAPALYIVQAIERDLYGVDLVTPRLDHLGPMNQVRVLTNHLRRLEESLT